MSIAEKLTQIAENEQKVYDAGYEKGKADGGDSDESYNQGVEDGKRAESERFWSEYTNRTYWGITGVFSGYAWNFNNFYPACDIRPVGGALQLFYNWTGKNHTGSLKQRFEECGVVLDTSQATDLTSAFNYCYVTEIPTIDCTGLSGGSTHIFANHYENTKTIEKLIVKESVTYNSWFSSTNLANIEFEGVIGQDLDFGYSSRLTKASIESIISHLSDSATGKTLTLSKKAAENAFTDTEWDALESTKTNWTISLV